MFDIHLIFERGISKTDFGPCQCVILDVLESRVVYRRRRQMVFWAQTGDHRFTDSAQNPWMPKNPSNPWCENAAFLLPKIRMKACPQTDVLGRFFGVQKDWRSSLPSTRPRDSEPCSAAFARCSYALL